MATLPILATLLLAQGGGVQTTVLLHPDDPMPGRPGETIKSTTVHAIHEGTVAYTVASGITNLWYRQQQTQASHGGTATVIYTQDDFLPGTSLTFHTFDPMSLWQGTCFVREKDEHSNVIGIYSGNGGAVQTEIDLNAGIGGFEPYVSADGAHLTFVTGRSSTEELWVKDLNSGTVTRVVGAGDPMPGIPGSLIVSVAERGKPRVRGNLLVSDMKYTTGSPDWDYYTGVVRYDLASGSLQRLADHNTDVPGHGTGFDFYAPVTDGSRVMFEGIQGMIGFGGWAGLYLWEDGAWSTIVDMDTPKPDNTGNFYTFNGVWTSYAMEGDIFIIPDSGPVGLDGVYAKIGETLVKIVRWGENVPRGVVYRIKMAPECYSQGQIALGISHEFGGADGIYIFDIPVPELQLNLVGALQRGTSPLLVADSAQSGERVYFTYGIAGVLFEGGPCPPGLGGMCLDLLDPVTLIGSANAAATGRASLPVTVPNQAPLIPVWFQAVAPRGNASVKSSVITAQVEA